MYLDRESMIFGMVIGALFAGFGGIIMRRIAVSRIGTRAPDRPMVVPTSGTPRDVLRRASAAARSCLVWTLIGLLFLLVSGGVFYYLIVEWSG